MSSPPSDNLLSVFRPDCLKDKVAILSGGGSGITFRIAEAFVSHGCSVVICSRSLARLEQAAEELRAAGKGVARCVPIQCDVRDENAVAALVKRTLAELGRIDILVNGAAGNFLAPAERLTANGMRSVLEIDVLGTFLLSKHVFSAWMKHHGGSIVNITATLHWNGELLQVHAGSAKAAIEAMTRHLANEWGKYGVRVNNIAPGPIEETEGFRKLGGKFLTGKDDVGGSFLDSIALRRFGKAQDIAQSALFLATNASNYITGTTICADGGAWFFSGGRIGRFLETSGILQRSSRL